MDPLQAGSNEYENARQKRILRNQQVLADLGLTTGKLPARHAEVPAVARKSRSEQVSENLLVAKDPFLSRVFILV